MEIHVAIVAVLEILVWHLLPNYAFTGQCCRATRYRPTISFLLYRISNIEKHSVEKSQTNNAKPPDTVLLSLFFFFRIFQISQKVIHISVLIIFFFIKSPILHDKIYSDKLRKYKLLLKCFPLPCSECNDMSVVSVLSDIRYLVRYLYMQLYVWSVMNICNEMYC